MKRLLIVNADDLGWSEPINRGIVDCHLHGVLTSATLMTTMPGAEDAVSRVRDHGRLGVGVHLTLTAGCPVSLDPSVRRLAPGGRFPASTPRLLFHARTSGAWRHAARTELGAQVRWMMDHDLVPDHIDSHKHFHVVPPFPEMVGEIAEEFGIRLVRSTRERPVGSSHRLAGRLGRRMLARWDRRARITFGGAGLVQPEEFYGIADTGSADLEAVQACLASSQAASLEWMVHPGEMEENPPVSTRLVRSRPEEKKMLTDPALRDMIDRLGFALGRFGELLT